VDYNSGKTGVVHALLFAGTEEGGFSSTKSSEIYLHLHKHGRVKMLLIPVKSGTGRISRNSALVVRWYRNWRHLCAFSPVNSSRSLIGGQFFGWQCKWKQR
jgi:hypothetical protein